MRPAAPTSAIRSFVIAFVLPAAVVAAAVVAAAVSSGRTRNSAARDGCNYR
jgi:hypothetical protein